MVILATLAKSACRSSMLRGSHRQLVRISGGPKAGAWKLVSFRRMLVGCGMGVAASSVILITSASCQSVREYDFVIVGGGMSAVGGLVGLREENPQSSVVVVGGEMGTFKRLLEEEGAEMARRTRVGTVASAKEMQNVGFEVAEVEELDVDGQMIVMKDGQRLRWRRGCLLATDPQFVGDGEEKLKFVDDKDAHVVVVGGGAAACAKSTELVREGVRVAQIFEEGTPMARLLPHYVGSYIIWHLKRLGVDAQPYSKLQYCRALGQEDAKGDKQLEGVLEIYVRRTYDALDVKKYITDFLLYFAQKINFSSGYLLANATNSLEMLPSGELIANCELCLRSSLFAAGPMVSVPHPLFGRLVLQDKEEAWVSGVCAGRNMAGRRTVYRHVPVHNSVKLGGDFELLCVGEVNSSLETVGFWSMRRWQMQQEPSTNGMPRRRSSGRGGGEDDFLPVMPQSGVLYFLKKERGERGGGTEEEKRLVGVALVNMPEGGAEVAREAIRQRRRVREGEDLRQLIAVESCESGQKALKRTTEGKANAAPPPRHNTVGANNDKWTRAIFGTLPDERPPGKMR
ncbi:hypothetical protein GUITHDRAFT_145603 [Guillardia theta CCMP2712]|uniref:FAD/NAD(P)-binding domain-containing protein n=1 Tax=Guillardia theta (strain CCMP2712) TaxID=905079 RepID=L1ILH7_GUITC|nr:hypothetical protein GUITHDRAFT_145603 [Guillardia theta CCMP2712]EKX36650.1 hypothetical protein GUITHDRAFT_145603 [Guillardia theta CCMP2712]|eukprot:XP_005823630.1 hypothetical protein GUITHDRAFT_145603 [Guillardia theta CCMP2712]